MSMQFILLVVQTTLTAISNITIHLQSLVTALLMKPQAIFGFILVQLGITLDRLLVRKAQSVIQAPKVFKALRAYKALSAHKVRQALPARKAYRAYKVQ